MKTTIKGIRYHYKIFNSKVGRNSYDFSIKAIDKATGRTSSINNVNVVLSELNVDAEKKKFEDSTWIVTKKQAKRFSEFALDFLTSKSFLPYLENRLDEDRQCGEWGNHES